MSNIRFTIMRIKRRRRRRRRRRRTRKIINICLIRNGNTLSWTLVKRWGGGGDREGAQFYLFVVFGFGFGFGLGLGFGFGFLT